MAKIMSYADYLIKAGYTHAETKILLHRGSSTDLTRRNNKILFQLKTKLMDKINKMTIDEGTEELQRVINELAKHGYTLDIKIGLKEIKKSEKQKPIAR